MKKFSTKIDLRNRQEMTDFLADHPSYWTMNSWNQARSYANCVKLHRLGIPSQDLTKAYEMLDVEDPFFEIQSAIDEFGSQHDYEWQAGFNGRSQGYLVLYKGGKKNPGYKTRCNNCGKLTWYETEQPCHITGCHGRLTKIKSPVYQLFRWPGKGIDMDRDYDEWDIDYLRHRVRLVQDFDKLCDRCVDIFVYYVNSYEVVEEIISVPKTIKTLSPLTAVSQ